MADPGETIPPFFYRVSTKALILDETRTKFLIVQESNGKWEFPGGGLEYGSGMKENIAREIGEEMQVPIIAIAEDPAYIMQWNHDRTGSWTILMFYETVLKHLDFTASRECNAVMFVDKDSLPEMMYSCVPKFAGLFDPQKHLQQDAELL